MRKILALIVLGLLVLSAAGCGQETKVENESCSAGGEIDKSQSPEVRKDFEKLLADQALLPVVYKFLQGNMDKVTPEDGDHILSAFIEFQNRPNDYAQRLQTLLDSGNGLPEQFFKYMSGGRDLAQIEDGRLKQVIIDAQKAGLYLYSPEGMACTGTDYTTLLRDYGDYVSPDFKAYLRLKGFESDQPFGEDGALVISWDELARRLVENEKYLKTYPQSQFAEEIKKQYDNYLVFYLVGMDNTPVFGYEDLLLNEEVKASYGNTVEKYKDTDVGRIIEEYLKVLEKNHFKRSEEVNTFIMQQIGKK